MVLPWFGSSRPSSVDELIGKKKYARALELIRAALRKRRSDRRLRLRLADVLVLAGQQKEAVAVLNSLADDVALAGNAAQAIALLKRVESIEPGRPDVEEKLAYYIRQREQPGEEDAQWLARRREQSLAVAFDMEEIADDGPAELQLFEPAEEPEILPEEPDAEEPTPAPPAPEPAAPRPAPPVAAPAQAPGKAPPAPPPAPARVAPPAASRPQPPPAKKPPAPKRVKLRPSPAPAASPATAAPSPPPARPAGGPSTQVIDAALRDELTALLEEVLSPVEDAPDELPAGGAAASPLFSDLSQEELVELIRGLRLERYEPGAIVVTEGEQGGSLFVIASGSVRAFVRTADGRNQQVRELGEGEFFGEVSLLSGSPRTATVTAASLVELLVLDRSALDRIVARHSRVREVLREFYDQRAGSTVEARIREMGTFP